MTVGRACLAVPVLPRPVWTARSLVIAMASSRAAEESCDRPCSDLCHPGRTALALIYAGGPGANVIVAECEAPAASIQVIGTLSPG